MFMSYPSNTPTTTPETTPTFSFLIKTINPWSDNHPSAALDPLLQQLHSTLEVLYDYTLYHAKPGDDPIYTNIVCVIQSAVSMAKRSCDHYADLESNLIATSEQLKAIAAQHGEEV
jgi:hypothetical protein